MYERYIKEADARLAIMDYIGSVANFKAARDGAEGALYAIVSAPTADVVPKSEVERLQAEVERLKKDNEYILMQHRFQRRPSGDCWNDVIEKAKAEVAREIFEEIDNLFDKYPTLRSIGGTTIAELKKKYTGE